jgi:hypothetical protein
METTNRGITPGVASKLHNIVLSGVLVSAFAINEIIKNNYYRELGYESAKEYCGEALPFDYRQALRYCKIATKFSETYNDMSNKMLELIYSSNSLKEVTSMSLLPMEDANRIGMAKLYELSRLSNRDFEDIIIKGEKISGIDKADIERMSVRELHKRIMEILQQPISKENEIKVELQKRNIELHIEDNKQVIYENMIVDAIKHTIDAIEHTIETIQTAKEFGVKIIASDEIKNIYQRLKSLMEG